MLHELDAMADVLNRTIRLHGGRMVNRTDVITQDPLPPSVPPRPTDLGDPPGGDQ